MRGWGMSRRALFEALDQPALVSLPRFPYEYAEWKRCRVNLDYHVEIAKHYYSVPHQLIRQEVEARITTTTVEIFHRGKRVASHRSCIGILRLVKRYGAERVDAACARALVLGTRSYSSVAAILKNRREHTPAATAEPPLLIHENIRGPGYYH